ncbi:adenosine deaminase-like protein [Folsomia candida]|uniref:Adenosine deaminase-like protein n=1 Tax=Folsomia candida TaxID=158441 RepID=A0A226EUX8_FOLCA|nr:adenosine deaminase-like protein [Folsomia candida]OXA61425.1 Adenosine deaminase-like protein [Folsomia candida]
MANSKKDLTIEQICELMPKVELHAHLNGSISDSIIRKLKLQNSLSTPCDSTDNNRHDDDCIPTEKRLKKTDRTGEDEEDDSHSTNNIKSSLMPKVRLELDGKPSLSECWKAFAKIHQVIQTPEILFQATCEVIHNFVKDNVIYLELRTTPKKIHDIPSKQIYIETVIKAIKHCVEEDKLPIIVKLLISIDRGNSARNYLENVCLAQLYMNLEPEIVVGLDLCGNPNTGDTKSILFALNFSKKMGQRVSVHLPEVINENETKLFLEHGANRVAHGQYLHPSTGGTEELWKILKDSGICMEACITSNLISGVSPTLEQHYVKLLHDDNIPFTICTDDCGVFNSNLSQEYKKFVQLVPNLSKHELKMLCIRSTTYIFGDTVLQANLAQQINTWWDHNVGA